VKIAHKPVGGAICAAVLLDVLPATSAANAGDLPGPKLTPGHLSHAHKANFVLIYTSHQAAPPQRAQFAPLAPLLWIKHLAFESLQKLLRICWVREAVHIEQMAFVKD